MTVETPAPHTEDAPPASSGNQRISGGAVLRGQGQHALTMFAASLAAGATVFGLQALNSTGGKGRLETACASILNVLNPVGSTFERNGSSLNAGDTVVRMLYSVNQPSGDAKRVVVLCAFDTANTLRGVPQLTAASVNGHQLGPARLTFLNRFWLPSEEAAVSLPAGKPAQPAQSGAARPSEPG